MRVFLLLAHCLDEHMIKRWAQATQNYQLNIHKIMTTVINGGGDNGNGVGMVLSVVLVIVLIVLFFVYGLPAIRGANNNNDTTHTIDVNVK